MPMLIVNQMVFSISVIKEAAEAWSVQANLTIWFRIGTELSSDKKEQYYLTTRPSEITKLTAPSTLLWTLIYALPKILASFSFNLLLQISIKEWCGLPLSKPIIPVTRQSWMDGKNGSFPMDCQPEKDLEDLFLWSNIALNTTYRLLRCLHWICKCNCKRECLKATVLIGLS